MIARVIKKLFITAGISAILYIGIAAALIYWGAPEMTVTEPQLIASQGEKLMPASNNISFTEMLTDYSNIPQLQTYAARDGIRLAYRYYPSESNNVLILVHGSGWHSQQFYSLAKFISAQGLAQVYTPDLRGHGVAPRRRGDIDYIGQFEDDLADLLAFIRLDSPDANLIMGGHSSGGGLAIRFAGSQYGANINAYLLLAPFIYYNAPTTRPNAGGWAEPFTARIIGLSMLNNVGIHWFDALTSIRFNMPAAVRNGTETLAYSHRLNLSYAPRDYGKDLQAITQPLLVIAGSSDETMYADKYQMVISKYTSAQIELLPNVTHMGVVVNPATRPVLARWLTDLQTP